jgi:lipopolysaccharide/colanic/teichoic acid biosynthesis glycosyltransferase
MPRPEGGTDGLTILHVTTIPMSLVFLRGQVGYMKARGLDVHAISSPGREQADFAESEGIDVSAVTMPRRITPFLDLVAVARIVRTIRRIRPTIVHAHTPKGGLLGMIAAAISGVPVRIYHMRGLPMMTAAGARRLLLSATEWLACRLAHRVICVSKSLREVAVSEGLCAPEKIAVLLGGSGNGVDAVGRFDPARLGEQARAHTRRRLGIPDDAVVAGFVGRLVRDKGIAELAEAWAAVRAQFPEAHLLLVGPYEPQDPVPTELSTALRQDPRVHHAGEDWNSPPLYAAMDVVVLPTYREGFPNVPLEAAAMGLPVVATRIPGCVDAVADGVTGTLVPVRDARALADALGTYLRDAALRRLHGENGRERVLREFRQERLWEALYAEYLRMLEATVNRSRSRHDLVARALDVAAACVLLVLLSPVLAITALLVRSQLGPPVLFRQVRPGRGGKPFTIYKFRTMRDATSADGVVLPDAQRLSPFGRALRASSLDELPELWNVLRGDMSLVGPRPLLLEYLPLYSVEQARRHDVRPGITGWAQVNGRNARSWRERLALDVWYVDHRSVLLDLRILLLTIGAVLRRSGVSQPGHATVERFRGSER